MDGTGWTTIAADGDDGIVAAPVPATVVIGRVLEVGAGTAAVAFDADVLAAIRAGGRDDRVAAGEIGSQIKMRVGVLWLVASVRTLALDPLSPARIVAQVDFIGEGIEGPDGRLCGFRRGTTRLPLPGSRVTAADDRDMACVFAADDRAHIEIGTAHASSGVRATLYTDALLGRHFALVGSTGTGKSTALALILHRICAASPEAHIVMIDPHGEYPAAFDGYGELIDVDNLALPYWLMNFEEHAEILLISEGAERQRDTDVLAKCLLAARTKARAAEGLSKVTVDSPIPYLLSDLANLIVQEMGKLDRAGDTGPYMRIKARLDELRHDPRYAFMFSGMLVGDTMAATLARVFRLPTHGKPISIVDVSGVPSEVTSVVVALLSRLVFDHAIWARQETTRPILLVCEEAHRYIPSDRDATGGAVRRVLERIAKEGRKYGVALGLVTQRPSDLAEGVLSQCGTVIAMRLNNERDQARVRSAMPEGGRGLTDAIPALRNRECVICGEGVPVPIRVRLDELEEEKRPASADPLFSRAWREVGGEPEAIARTVARWRRQGR